MSWESAATLCLLAWWQAEREHEFFVEDWRDSAGADNGTSALVERVGIQDLRASKDARL